MAAFRGANPARFIPWANTSLNGAVTLAYQRLLTITVLAQLVPLQVHHLTPTQWQRRWKSWTTRPRLEAAHYPSHLLRATPLRSSRSSRGSALWLAERCRLSYSILLQPPVRQ